MKPMEWCSLTTTRIMVTPRLLVTAQSLWLRFPSRGFYKHRNNLRHLSSTSEVNATSHSEICFSWLIKEIRTETLSKLTIEIRPFLWIRLFNSFQNIVLAHLLKALINSFCQSLFWIICAVFFSVGTFTHTSFD